MDPDNKSKWLVRAAVAACVVLALVAVVWVRWHRLPAGIMQDVRAGLAARHIKNPDARIAKFLEVRFGDLSNPENREAAFVTFFDVEHIKALQLLVRHAPETQRQASVDAMARWLAAYRESMSPQERASLNARFQTPEGRAMLRRATAQYNAQDVRYRGSTAPVISQLLRTLNTVEQVP